MAIADKITTIDNAIQTMKTNLNISSSSSLSSLVNETQGAVKPTGTVNITQNGTVDVTNYSSANVNVSGSSTILNGKTINCKANTGTIPANTFIKQIIVDNSLKIKVATDSIDGFTKEECSAATAGEVCVFPRIPSEYQEVEYIEGLGSQWINLNITPTSANGFKAKIMFGRSGSDYSICGSQNNNNSRWGVSISSSNVWQAGNPCGSYFANGGSAATNIQYEVRYNIESSKTLLVNNEAPIKSMTTGNNNVGILYLFALHYNNEATYIPYMKLYSFEMYGIYGKKILDLIPCYRKNDNVIGLYDLINGTFYTNSGTGNFIKGLDIN